MPHTYSTARPVPWRGVVSDDRTGDLPKPRCPQCDTGVGVMRADGIDRRRDYDQWQCLLCGGYVVRRLAVR